MIMVIFLAVSSTSCKTCQSNTIHSEAPGFYNITNNVIAEDAEKMFWEKWGRYQNRQQNYGKICRICSFGKFSRNKISKPLYKN
jgi:hypothetical protein